MKTMAVKIKVSARKRLMNDVARMIASHRLTKLTEELGLVSSQSVYNASNLGELYSFDDERLLKLASVLRRWAKETITMAERLEKHAREK
jgi:hypothetical protein